MKKLASLWLSLLFALGTLTGCAGDVSIGVIGVIGLIVSISIQPWTSQWMDVVSIYICPLGAALAGVMFFWVLSKKSALEEVNNGAKKPIGPWFYILGKYIYIPFAIAALVLGIKYGGIG